jgi:hypothetical protein
LALAIGVPVAPSLAQTEEGLALALLRAASAQLAIITFCAKQYTVDDTTALRISQTARGVAAKILGENKASVAFMDELARRYGEVKKVGKAQWCADQREALTTDGITIFKN